MLADAPEELDAHTPAAKLVYLAITDVDGRVTYARLEELTRLPAGTIRNAVGDLKDGGFAETRPKLDDVRKSVILPAGTERPGIGGDGA